jgi:hypothetical protein
MLSDDVQAQVGGYDDYVAFWNTIDDVAVSAVSSTGDLVTVHLTYTNGGGQEAETRELRVERVNGRWTISDDLGAVA